MVVTKKVDGVLDAENIAKHSIHGSVIGGKQLLEHAGQNHPAQKMRQIADGLDGFLEWGVGDLVEHERKNDRSRETKEQFQAADNQRVLDRTDKGWRGKGFCKVVQTTPCTSENAAADFVILESNDHTAHGDIFKHDKIDKHREKHQCKRKMLFVSAK